MHITLPLVRDEENELPCNVSTIYCLHNKKNLIKADRHGKKRVARLIAA